MTSRRDFLRGRISRPAPVLRPPWALDERDFLAACTRCDACVRACPTGAAIRVSPEEFLSIARLEEDAG